MSREQNSNRESKKKAQKTLKEKRADKKTGGDKRPPILNIGKSSKD